MRIDEGVKREVLGRTDIGAFIGQYVSLRKRGNDLVGLCPFHGEKTPSFHVHPDRGFFKCFGCGKGGDVISFVMALEGATFPDALRALAKRAGVAIEDETPQAARVRSEREQIYAANECAATYFHRVLRTSPEAAGARGYVERRGLLPATVESFKLGYAPSGWNGLVDELRAGNHDLAIAAKAGLVKAGERGYYDFYRARLMIPTYATTGEAIAFGGRALDDSQPKYLNTSTTPVYVKGRSLFALGTARRHASAQDAFVVVEGYLDCIALHQAGVTNAVASLGTAFTAEQAAELRKYAQRVFVCFDADAAGTAATAKSIDVLEDADCRAFVVTLPLGEDPDSFVRSHGSAAFAELIAAALPWIQFKIDREIAGIMERRLPRANAVQTAERLVRSLPREEWDRWRIYVAQALELAPDDLRSARFVANPANFAPRAVASARMTRHVAVAAEPPQVDREVLAALIDEPALATTYAGLIPAETFRDSRYRAIYEMLCERSGTLSVTADVYAALAEDRDAVELLVALQKPDRSSKLRFENSVARREFLDRVAEGVREEADERRWRDLDHKIDAAFDGAADVSSEERDEHRRLGELREGRKRKRLGTR